MAVPENYCNNENNITSDDCIKCVVQGECSNVVYDRKSISFAWKIIGMVTVIIWSIIILISF